jgi:polyphenol oxidase
MISKQYDGLQWLEFELFADCPLIHGCFTRHGGISNGPLSSLNLGRNVGDAPGNVEANFKKVARALSVNEIISAKLCHGNAVNQVIKPTDIPLSDGLSTSIPNIAIAITQADCQAAIFYDPIHHAMAHVHCGWRGSALNIYANTVTMMECTYGSNPADLLVGISPSLGPDHAEFINYRTELPECLWQFKDNGYLFDFWAVSRWQLETAGVLSDHIQIAEIDTYASEDYFSHRRATHQQMRQSGRQATVCALRAVPFS